MSATGFQPALLATSYRRRVRVRILFLAVFTIGLWQLHPNGSTVLDEAGQPIPTYDNGDIMNFARVFTGFIRQSSRSNTEVRSAEAPNYYDPADINVK